MADGPEGRAAWRILDAQYFGLAQRRRRVFVIFCPRNGGDPAAVLFERQGVRGHIAPRREAREGVAGTISSRTQGGGGLGTDFDLDGGLVARAARDDIDDCLREYMAFVNNNTAGPVDVATACNAHGGPHDRLDFESETFVTHALRADGFDASEDGAGRGTPIVPVCFNTTQITSKANLSNPQAGDPCHSLLADAHAPAISFSCKDYGADAGEVAPTMRAMGHAGSHPNAGGQIAVHAGHAVRRLTPSECEALQGFRRNYTRIPMRHYKTRKITKNRPEDRWEKDPAGGWWLMSCDGERYKALGNSMATPCMAWIGRQIIAKS
jgi:DNA (cytosine-5)-methyltransferase 1